MISSSVHSHAASLYAALPIGQAQIGSKDTLAHESTFKPIEPLESSQRAALRTRETTIVGETAVQGPQEPGDRETDLEREKQEALAEERREKQVEQQEQREIADLSARDREVRAHEQAHAAVGGQYAGAPTYEFQRGPDGVSYAVGGEVSIDVGKAGTPQETLEKAQIVRRAALAPADPSPQDRRVAAEATRMEAQARADIAAERTNEAQEAKEERSENAENNSTQTQDIGFLGDSPTTNTLADNRSGVSEQGQSSFSTPSSRISSLDTPRISPAGERLQQILASTDVGANRPGALLSQIV